VSLFGQTPGFTSFLGLHRIKGSWRGFERLSLPELATFQIPWTFIQELRTCCVLIIDHSDRFCADEVKDFVLMK